MRLFAVGSVAGQALVFSKEIPVVAGFVAAAPGFLSVNFSEACFFVEGPGFSKVNFFAVHSFAAEPGFSAANSSAAVYF